MLKVYEYEKCSTCRKALKFLDARGVRYRRVPIVERPPTPPELQEMLRRVGDIRRLFNASGKLYRELKLAEKLPRMSEEAALDFLARHGKLVRRPFALGATVALVGFDEAEWKEAFAK